MEGFLISIFIVAAIVVVYKFREDLQKKKLGAGRSKIYNSVQEATVDYQNIITERYLTDSFYPIKVYCSNCKLKGTIYIEHEITAEGSTCPECFVDGLKVLGKGNKNIVYKPPLSEETATSINDLVDRFVQEGESDGHILKKDGLFR